MPQLKSRAQKLVLSSFLVTLLSAPSPSFGAVPGASRVPIGELTHEGGLAVRETTTLPSELLARLGSAAVGERVEIAAFPVGPGFRAAVRLDRVDPYAPGARVWEMTAQGPRELPRSSRLYFLGAAVDDANLRVGLSLDRAAGALNGLVGRDGRHQFLQGGKAGKLEIVGADHLLPEGVALEYLGCGTEDVPLSAADRARVDAAVPILFKASVPTREAVVAVDTDNEFMSEKFADDTTAATSYIADLFTEMNVIYERDLQLRLLIGDTFLRTDPDPYTQTSTSAQLTEFSNHWNTTYDDIARVFAMLLSGKSPSISQAAGRASLNVYCSESSGYSVNQVFKLNNDASLDVSLVAHELGHNFGSPHTHCYTPAIDQCYNLEGGCYAGTTSCPAGGQGTLMSYCHLGACGQFIATLEEFHPTVIGFLDLLIEANRPGCIADLGQSFPEIFADGFELGNTLAWSSTVP